MRLVADECLDSRLVEGLRRAGHDVLAVRDAWRGIGDRAILEGARREYRARPRLRALKATRGTHP